MTKATAKILQKSGSSTLFINGQTDSPQLLLTVCRNSTQWLSPVGWGPAEKGTLLDCRQSGEGCEIDIPKEHAEHLKSGDDLRVKCHELGLDASVKWKAQAAAKSSGLLSRFSSGSAEKTDALPAVTDTERRAQEAQKAADVIRAQMENAQLAKEAAHQRALDAARLAEEARIAEERGIAEMEKAAKALAEAEAKRAEEIERLEAERLAEEARRIKEARIAEEARLAELARLHAQELAQEKTALLAELDEMTLREDRSAQSVSDLEHEMRKAKNAAADKLTEMQTLGDTLTLAQGSLASEQERVSVADSAYQSAKTKLSGIENVLAETHAEDQRVQGDIAMAQSVYDKAQAEADAAVEHAKAMKKAWQAAREQRSAVSNTLNELTARHDLEAQNAAKAQSVVSALSRDHSAAEDRVKALQVQIDQIADVQKARKAAASQLERDYLVSNHDLEQLTERRVKTEQAIALIDNGAELAHVRAMLDAPSNVGALQLPRDFGDETQSVDHVEAEPLSTKIGKFASRFKRNKSEGVDVTPAPALAAQAVPATIFHPGDIDVDSQDTTLDAAPDAFMADNDRGPLMPILMASAATIAIVALVGTVAMRGPKSNEIIAVAPQAAPKTQVLSTATPKTVVQTPNSLDEATPAPTAEEALAATTLDNAEVASESEIDENVVAVSAKSETPTKSVETAYAHPEWMAPYNSAEAMAAMREQKELREKKAEQVKARKREEAALAARQARATKPVPKAQTSKKQTPSRASVEITPPKTPVPKPIATAPTEPQTPSAAYIELTKDVQTRLTALGFYSGTIDGQRSEQTLTAMRDFKSLFELEVNDDLSGEFLNKLKQASAQAAAAPVQTAAQSIAPVKSTPQPIATPPLENAAAAASEPAVVETASLISVAPKAEPVPEDVIIPAKRVGAISAEYPTQAIRRGFDSTVKVKIAYSVTAQGEVVGAKVESIDGAGRYERYFTAAAFDAINGQTFTPKTINGEAVASAEHASNVTFRLQ